MALVPFDDSGARKQNRELLKMKAKALAAGKTKDGKDAEGGVKVGNVLFDIDAGADDDGTFVTGLGIPGKSKKQAKHH